jgi:hypothetical protein
MSLVSLGACAEQPGKKKEETKTETKTETKPDGSKDETKTEKTETKTETPPPDPADPAAGHLSEKALRASGRVHRPEAPLRRRSRPRPDPMRLPLRHPPPGWTRRCAAAPTSRRSPRPRSASASRPRPPSSPPHARGRFGNALQWHFGLDPHDSSEQLDWEDRVELKLVSVWRRRDGRLACDKLKVCDITADPWRKLGNVLWVFADRMTRVIVGHRFNRLAGPARSSLAAAWDTTRTSIARPCSSRPASRTSARPPPTTSAPPGSPSTCCPRSPP